MQLKQSYLAQHLEIYIFKTKDVCKYVTGSIALFLHTHTHTWTQTYTKCFFTRNFFFQSMVLLVNMKICRKKFDNSHKKYTAT